MTIQFLESQVRVALAQVEALRISLLGVLEAVAAEREVAERAATELVAEVERKREEGCPHANTVPIPTMGHITRRMCTDCATEIEKVQGG